MKYHYLYGTPDNFEKREIDLDTLRILRDYLKLKYMYAAPVSYLHVIMQLRKNANQEAYTEQEGLEILKSMNLSHEMDLKVQVHAMSGDIAAIWNARCSNCNHPRGWHFNGRKCCDGQCDCEEHQ